MTTTELINHYERLLNEAETIKSKLHETIAPITLAEVSKSISLYRQFLKELKNLND